MLGYNCSELRCSILFMVLKLVRRPWEFLVALSICAIELISKPNFALDIFYYWYSMGVNIESRFLLIIKYTLSRKNFALAWAYFRTKIFKLLHYVFQFNPLQNSSLFSDAWSVILWLVEIVADGKNFVTLAYESMIVKKLNVFCFR